MCTTCGCGDREHVHDHHHDRDHDHHHDHERANAKTTRTIRVERDLLAKNDRIAASNRSAFASRQTIVVNLVGAPGAGKTALLESTIRRAGATVPLAVIEGDQATDRDAQRIEAAGGRAIQVNTGAGCHLDAQMIADGMAALAPPRGAVVLVENVGNLVCPALFDLGERAKVVVMSVTEGDDKPLKYPHAIRAASRLVLTKMDLLAHVDFDVERCIAYAREVNPSIGVSRVSSRTGEGIDGWCRWLFEETASVRQSAVASAP